MKSQLTASKLKFDEERQANRTLTRELKYHKGQMHEAEEAKKEAYRLQKKLNDLSAVNEVLTGQKEVTIRHSQKLKIGSLLKYN